MTTTPMWMLLDERLGGELEARILAMRADGLSLGKIARQLSNETGYDVSTETIRRWLGTIADEAAS